MTDRELALLMASSCVETALDCAPSRNDIATEILRAIINERERCAKSLEENIERGPIITEKIIMWNSVWKREAQKIREGK